MVGEKQARSFYQVAALGLRALERREPAKRRFGPDATARWELFKGELGDADRLDLLLRDAAVKHPFAFAPRAVFNIEGLSGDEPFGPDWLGSDPTLASTLLRNGDAMDYADVGKLLRQAATLWDMQLEPIPTANLEAIGPATRILAAGAGAVLSLATFFAARSGMDFADQVVLLSDHPGERQSFGLANVLLETATPVRVLRCDVSTEEARAVIGRRIDVLALSDDAGDDQRRAAESIRQGLAA